MSQPGQATSLAERAVTWNARRLTVLASGLGLLSVLLGGAVIVGWHAHIQGLTQIHSAFAAMAYNTALCFVLSGLALAAVARGNCRAAVILGAFVAALAALTLLQYPLNADLGLDQLFFKPYLTPRTSHLGRMAPLAATCFSLVGITTVWLTICERRKSNCAWPGLFSSMVVALCAAAVFGYVIRLDGADAWSQFSRIAIHTALGLGLLGTGLFVLAWRAAFVNTGHSPRWLPGSVMLSALMATVVLWRALVTENHADIAKILEAHAASVQGEVNSRLQQHLQSLTRMAARWEFSGAPERRAWEHDAATVVRDHPGFQAIEWIDSSRVVRWVAPIQGNEKQPGQQILSEPWRRALNTAKETRQTAVTRLDERVAGFPALAICVPIYRENQCDGFIVGLARVQELLDGILPSTLAAGYSIAIEDGEIIYQRDPSPRPSEPQWIAPKTIGVDGLQWTARVWPRPDTRAAQHSQFALSVLVAGVLGSMLLGLTVFLAQRSHAQARAAALAGQTLHEKQQFLEVLLDNLHVGVVACDANGKISLFNGVMQRLHGLLDSNVSSGELPAYFGLFQADGKTLLKPEEVPLVRALRGEIVHEMEVVVAQKDHAPRTLLANGQQIVTPTGRKLGAVMVLLDITERKRAEEALRKSSDRLSLATESARIGIWEYDLEANTLLWDKRICALYGIRPEDFSSAYEAWERGVHPEDLAAARAELEDAIAGKKEFHTQFRVVWPDGQIHFVEAHAVVQRAPNGTPLRAIGVNWDISERKRAEESLRQLQTLHGTILNAAAYGIHGIDAAGRIVFENPASVRMLGWEAAELIGKPAHLTMHHTRADGTAYPVEQCPIYAALRDGQVNYVFDEVFWRKDGSSFPVEYTIAALRGEHDEITGVVVVFADITERKKSEVVLRESEERFRDLFENSSDLIQSVAPDGHFLYVNRAWLDVLGYTREELPSLTLSDILEPGCRQHCQELFQRLITTGTAEHADAVFVGKHGQRVVVEGTTNCRLEQGRPVATRGIFRDVTERKRAQADLENLHTQLLDASRRSGMAEIATNVLHNVGNVLTSVNISAGLIVEGVRKFRTASLARVVVLLQEHAQDLGAFLTTDSRGKQVPAYLAQLSGHLLAEQAALTSELDCLRRDVEHIKEIVAMQQNYATFGAVKEMINLVTLVEDSLRMIEDAFKRERVEVVREFESVPPMNVEKHKILQILVNLLRNAKHACQDSERADKRVTVRVANGEGRVKISVMDNGVGIPPENLTRIFNHGFTTRKSGHGFGLHSSALAAKEMGGSLTVHSDGPGQGAAFTLELPGPDAGERT
ncbi:MAG: PAS domain S-box protein [Limisphaerales bacterium]